MPSIDGTSGESRSFPVSMFDTPSMVMLVEPNHSPPPTTGFWPVAWMPGASVNRLNMLLRPLSGIPRTWCESTTLPIWDVSDCTTGAPAVTSTLVATSPTSSFTSTRTVWFT